MHNFGAFMFEAVGLCVAVTLISFAVLVAGKAAKELVAHLSRQRLSESGPRFSR